MNYFIDLQKAEEHIERLRYYNKIVWMEEVLALEPYLPITVQQEPLDQLFYQAVQRIADGLDPSLIKPWWNRMASHLRRKMINRWKMLDQYLQTPFNVELIEDILPDSRFIRESLTELNTYMRSKKLPVPGCFSDPLSLTLIQSLKNQKMKAVPYNPGLSKILFQGWIKDFDGLLARLKQYILALQSGWLSPSMGGYLDHPYEQLKRPLGEVDQMRKHIELSSLFCDSKKPGPASDCINYLLNKEEPACILEFIQKSHFIDTALWFRALPLNLQIRLLSLLPFVMQRDLLFPEDRMRRLNKYRTWPGERPSEDYIKDFISSFVEFMNVHYPDRLVGRNLHQESEK